MQLSAMMLCSMRDELQKIASFSSPSIVSAPSPGGDGGQLKPAPAKVVSTRKIVGKALGKTNLQKTNYTSVSTQSTPPDPTLTSEQKALTPPAVRS